MATPDWLQQYANQQGWDAPQPDPKDVDALQAYADSFGGPQQPAQSDIDDLQGTAAALNTPSPITDNDPGAPGNPQQGGAHGMLDFSIPQSWVDKGKKVAGAVQQLTGVNGLVNETKGLDKAVDDAAAKEHQKLLDSGKGVNASELAPWNRGQAASTPYPVAGTGNVHGDMGSSGEGTDAEPQPSPGHWVNGQWVRTVSPGALGDESDLETNRELHARTEADRAGQLAWQREQIYNRRSAELKAQQDAAHQEMQRQNLAREKAEDDYEHASKLASQAKIDPNLIFHDGGSGVLAGLGAALGAFGAAITHSPNFAQETINKQIEASLEAQKASAANAQKGADNAWQKLKLATGSAQQADNLYRIAALQSAQGQLDELNAGPQQRTQIDAALDQALDTQKAKALQFRLATEKYAPGYMTGGAPTGGASTDDTKVVQLTHDIGGFRSNTRYSFKTEKDAEEARKMMTAFGVIQRARDKMAALEKANPVDIYRPGSQAHSDAETIRLNAISSVGGIKGLPKLPIFDAQKFDEALTPSMWNAATGASATHRMDTYLQNARDEVEEHLQASAPELVHRHLNVNQRGEVTPGHHYTGEDIERKPMPKGFTVRDKGTGTSEGAPLQYKPEIRHVTETGGTGKGKKGSTVTDVEPEEDED